MEKGGDGRDRTYSYAPMLTDVPQSSQWRASQAVATPPDNAIMLPFITMISKSYIATDWV